MTQLATFLSSTRATRSQILGRCARASAAAFVLAMSPAIASASGALAVRVDAATRCSLVAPIHTHVSFDRTHVAANTRFAFDSTLLATYASGQSFADFLAATKARREGWLGKADSAQVDAALVQRARAVTGRYKLLVVAVDRCGDSMNSVPYLARLVDSVPNLELRVVLPEPGGAVQDQHRSMDGRRATPTIVLLDERGESVGCIVELPREIRRWAHSVRPTVSSDSLHAGIRAFYERDKGKGITTEAVEMLEAASAGRIVCERGASR